MKNILLTASVMALGAGAAVAGGIDRSGQGIGALFEKGSYAELSFGYVSPRVSGNDVAAFGGQASGDVAGNYLSFGGAYKTDLNDNISVAVIVDQPFGADILYGASSVALGGTLAKTTVTAVTGIAQYNFGNGFSAHGGLRVQTASGRVELRGLAYGALNGYNVALSRDEGVGYLVGVAYERPDIALRVALTYNSEVKFNFDTVERVGAAVTGTAPTEVSTPQSVNLDFQSGVAKDTLVFGSVRWADWSNFKIDPPWFTPVAGGGLVSLDDSTTYTLGVGRKFNESWSGALSVSYEKEGNPLVSPLAPTNGRLGATVAAIYTTGNMKITTGINYTKLGDAQPETGTPDTARANFTGNSAVGVGVKVGWTF
jgi:long-chain fatty acid transport protein